VCAQVTSHHRFAREQRDRLDIGELVGEPLILLTKDNMSRVVLASALAARGLTAQVIAETEVELMGQAIAASGAWRCRAHRASPFRAACRPAI
jgi:hypothetical protein